MGARTRKRPPVTTVMMVAEQEIDVIYKSIKNINLSVRQPHGRVRVSAPFHVSEARIRAVVLDRLGWIQSHQQRMAEEPARTPLAFVSGDHVMVWGAQQPLVVRPGSRSVARWNGELVILTCPPTASRDQRQSAIDRMYRRALEGELPGLLSEWEPVVGHRVSSVAYRKMKTRWGTCQPSTGVIRLNTELAKYHPVCLEYVLVHELVHLLESSHNQRFYGFMDKFLPDWRVRKQLLHSSGRAECNPP